MQERADGAENVFFVNEIRRRSFKLPSLLVYLVCFFFGRHNKRKEERYVDAAEFLKGSGREFLFDEW